MDYSAPEPTEETVARDIDAFTELTLPLAPDLTDRQIQQLATYRDMLYAR